MEDTTEDIVFIYALLDPRDEHIRYIGKTKDLPRRLSQHLSHIKREQHTYKARWIAELQHENREPIARIIEETTSSNWRERERYWIEFFRSNGEYLTNLTEGGEGFTGTHSEETKRKMSSARKGEKHSELWNQHIGAGNKGKVLGKHLSDETKAKISVSLRALNRKPIVSQETRDKISKKLRGIKLSEEACLKISQGIKNHWQSRGPRSDSSTGIRGISYRKDLDMYRVRCTRDGFRYSIGHFATLEEAVLALENFNFCNEDNNVS